MAERVELHESTMDGGVMRMRPVESLVIEPGETRVLEPGGLHLMMMRLKEPLVAGKHFLLTLEFAEAGRVQVKVMVTKGDGTGGMGHGDHSGQN
jgi:copper(I)-binding protein